MADERKLSEIFERARTELREKARREREIEKISRYRFNMTPRVLYDKLDEYVIGQEEARQRVCNAICYHYKALSRGISRGKSNLLLIGPTGSGKTYVIEKCSAVLNIPMIAGDATKFSAAGYVGDKVENLVQDLYLKTEEDLVAASRGIIYFDEIDKIASRDIIGRDVSGRDVQSGLLKMIEGCDMKVVGRSGARIMNTKNILFIGGGAFPELYEILKKTPRVGFNRERKEEADYGEALFNAKPEKLIEALLEYGMIPELLGRISVIARFKQLSMQDLIKILKNSKDSPIEEFKKDLKSYRIKAEFLEESYETIAELAWKRGLGARGLKSVIEESMTSFRFYLPDLRKTGIKKITISKESILSPEKTLLGLIEDKNKITGGKNGNCN